jgi:hypothetical protein
MKHHQSLLIKVESLSVVADVFKDVDFLNEVARICRRNL